MAWAWAISHHGEAVLGGPDAEHHFDQALNWHRRSPRIPDRARTQLALGEYLRRNRRRSDARGPLREALDTFETLGATFWAERARQELRASGETARRGADVTPGQLTPQEAQVAAQVRQGLSNKEVAARLFVSPRTVDFHLRNVYTKLGITSRTSTRRTGHDLTQRPAAHLGLGLLAAVPATSRRFPRDFPARPRLPPEHDGRTPSTTTPEASENTNLHSRVAIDHEITCCLRDAEDARQCAWPEALDAGRPDRLPHREVAGDRHDMHPEHRQPQPPSSWSTASRVSTTSPAATDTDVDDNIAALVGAFTATRMRRRRRPAPRQRQEAGAERRQQADQDPAAATKASTTVTPTCTDGSSAGGSTPGAICGITTNHCCDNSTRRQQPGPPGPLRRRCNTHVRPRGPNS